MAWYRIQHLQTGEVQGPIASLGGYDPAEWSIKELGRAPRAYEVLDAETGKLRDHRKGVQPLPRTRADLESYIRERVASELASARGAA